MVRNSFSDLGEIFLENGKILNAVDLVIDRLVHVNRGESSFVREGKCKQGGVVKKIKFFWLHWKSVEVMFQNGDSVIRFRNRSAS
jgi:hypothetical protein